MNFERVTRGEKLSTVKATAVQYGILVMMLALTAGLWRLQVLGAENFKVLAEQNRIRKVPVLAARGKLFDRENRLIVDNRSEEHTSELQSLRHLVCRLLL